MRDFVNKRLLLFWDSTRKKTKKKGFCMWMRSALLQQDCNNGEIVLCLSGGSLKQVA